MPIQLSISAPKAHLVRMALQNLEKAVPDVGRNQIYQTMKRTQDRLRESGQKPTYPIQWDSEKQRRAFFASNGFGGGIPHHRTGAYETGFVIIKTDNGYRLFNPSNATAYVGGNAYGLVKSRIHVGRWQKIRDVFDDEFEKLSHDVAEEMRVVARRSGFSS